MTILAYHVLGFLIVTVLIFIVEWLVLSILAFSWTVIFELALPLATCLFATAVFSLRNPMHALLALLGVFFSTVLFYIAAGIEFIGLVFLIVYVGAVAVLFLFVIMLLNVKSLTSTTRLIQYISQIVAIAGVILLFLQVQAIIARAIVALLSKGLAKFLPIEPSNAEAIAFYVRYSATNSNALVGLYTKHGVLFAVITIALFVALLGAIILATVTTERPTRSADIRPLPYTINFIFAAILFCPNVELSFNVSIL